MSLLERSMEPWEEMQRHGLDFADRLAQGFNGLLQSHPLPPPPSFPWPSAPMTPHHKIDPFLPSAAATADGVSAILDIGTKLGRAGAELGAGINGFVQQFFRQLPVPFRQDEEGEVAPSTARKGWIQLELDGSNWRGDAVERRRDDTQEFGGLVKEQLSGQEFLKPGTVFGGGLDGMEEEEEGLSGDLTSSRGLHKSQGSVTITSTYDSRTNDIDSSLVARGDLWRVEASHLGSRLRNETSPLFLVQLGPVLLVRDTTLLLPVHLSKQHLLWYGYDRKNGMHSICPAVWSKHRRWLMMSMICLKPFACTFMDLQFPNGQLTYVAGEGLTTSAFLPAFGGLLQAQGQYPGEMRFSYSCKNKNGTRFTPMVQVPDKSFSFGVVQPLAWKRSGIMFKPTIQFSLCPTFGGTNPGLHAELIHSIKEKLSVSCGCSCTSYPSAFASIAIGRSKWNGNVGSTGVVVKVETPLSNVGRSCFSVQLNSGVEF